MRVLTLHPRYFYTMQVISSLYIVGAKVVRMGVGTLVMFPHYHHP